MFDPLGTSGTTEMLQKALDTLALRHKTLANNVANVNVVGFRRSDVDFSEALQSAVSARQSRGLTVTHPRHIRGTSSSAGEAAVFQPDKPIPEGAASNVDIDEEMVALSENSLLYETYATLLSVKLATLRAAIRS
jgi:flagellar basal-body rod protein FlgB